MRLNCALRLHFIRLAAATTNWRSRFSCTTCKFIATVALCPVAEPLPRPPSATRCTPQLLLRLWLCLGYCVSVSVSITIKPGCLNKQSNNNSNNLLPQTTAQCSSGADNPKLQHRRSKLKSHSQTRQQADTLHHSGRVLRIVQSILIVMRRNTLNTLLVLRFVIIMFVPWCRIGLLLEWYSTNPFTDYSRVTSAYQP